MRKFQILFAVAALLLFAGCDEKEQLSTEASPIRFGVGLDRMPLSTKALLEPSDLCTSGTKLKVYGYAVDASTSVAKDIPGSGPTKLNDGQTVTCNAAGTGWSYDSGETYSWASGTDYRFFGWLEKDSKASTPITYSGFFGENASYNASTGVLTVPARQMGVSDLNFDFSYSDVVARPAAQASFADVELQLRHLFSSFSLAACNYTKEQVFIDRVTLHGLKDKKGAAVTFGGTEVSVAYGSGSVMSATNLVSSPIQLSEAGSSGDTKANIVNGASDAPKYFLVWPQTESDLTPATPYEEENWSPGDNEPYIEVVYRQSSPSAAAITAKVPFPYDNESDDESLNGWAPGVRRNMVLSFTEKKVRLTAVPGDWDKQSPVVDYNGAVSVTAKLRVASGFEGNCVLSITGDTAYFRPGLPIVLDFTIDQPVNSTWIVSKDSDFDAFEIDNCTDWAASSAKIGDKADSAEGVINSEISRIALFPRITELQKNEYVLKLSFSVRKNSSEMVNINSEIFDGDSPATFILLKD